MLQQLLGNLGGGLVGNVGPQQPRTQEKFIKYLGVSDGDAAYDTSAEVAALVQANTGSPAANFAKIWEMTVPAQTKIRWGFGTPQFQRNQGFGYAFFLDAGTGFEDGILRLVQENAQGTRRLVVWEGTTHTLHTSTNTSAATARPQSIDDKAPIPEAVTFPLVGEDSKLQLEFKNTDVTTTVDVAEFSIPATFYI